MRVFLYYHLPRSFTFFKCEEFVNTKSSRVESYDRIDGHIDKNIREQKEDFPSLTNIFDC